LDLDECLALLVELVLPVVDQGVSGLHGLSILGIKTSIKRVSKQREIVVPAGAS
jgi:hypothetical protein